MENTTSDDLQMVSLETTAIKNPGTNVPGFSSSVYRLTSNVYYGLARYSRQITYAKLGR